MTIFLSNALIYFVHAAFFAPWLRQTRAVTPGDAVRERFGAYTEQIFVYYSTFGGLIWGAVLLLALATFTSVIFGVPLLTVIFVVGGVIVFYSVLGGSWSVFTNDYLQAVILLPVTIAVAGLCLYEVGGPAKLLSEISAQGLAADFAWIKPSGHIYNSELPITRGLFTWQWTMAMVFNGILNAFNMTGCYRYLAVKTGNEARKAALLAGSLMLLGSVIWFIPPVTGRLLFSADINAVTGIGNPVDAAYAMVALKILPAGLVGLVVVAIFAASISTMDSALTGTAALIVKNIFPPIQRIFHLRERAPLELLRLSRVVNLCLGFTVVGLAALLNYLGGSSGLFNIMLQILVLVAAPMSLPFACALFIRDVPRWAAVFSIGTGLCASVAMTVATKGFGVEILWHQKIWIMALSTVPPFFATWLFRKTSPPSFYKEVDAFFEKIFTPIDFKEEVGEDRDLSQLRLVGKLGLAPAVMVGLLTFVAENTAERVAVGFVCAFILVISLLMISVGRRADREGEA